MNTQMQPDQPMQLSGEYGLWHIPFWQKTWFKLSAGLVSIIVLSIIGYALYYWWYAARKTLSSSEQALHDLQMLKKKGLCSSATSGQFYVGLTGILKKYLSSLYAVDIRSNTDHQMLEYIAGLPLFDAQKEGLSRIFSAGELIKFARKDALLEQMNNDWQFAVEFVTTGLLQQK